eukprot:TRINITY_DN6615_c0_g2_i1.p1 TRINITY_DN6615_c0_g2~~TRINITY_DN6615_c0_g2_i1.p1  ORF type:complete len:1071 (-),score=310.82 TRINITY_DN6615_c0_g2_i1:67-3279(-)
MDSHKRSPSDSLSSIQRAISSIQLFGSQILNSDKSDSNDPLLRESVNPSSSPRKNSTAGSDATEGEALATSVAELKTFLHKKIVQPFQKQKSHTCKVTLVTPDDTLELNVSDGTFASEGLVFLKKNHGARPIVAVDTIVEIGVEFDSPYDINATSLLDDILAMQGVRSVTLRTNALDRFPPQLGQLRNLTSLSLAGNQVKSLAPEIAQLRLLVTLNLSSNQLGTLPREIGHLQRLERLLLANNSLVTLPNTLHLLVQLSVLDLTNNRLSVLPEMTGMTRLQELYLDSNMLAHIDPASDSIIDRVKGIASSSSNMKAIMHLLNVTVLNLRNNKFESVPDACMLLSRLQKLDISSNRLTTLQVNYLSSTLRTLDASANLLAAVPPKISALSALQELDLSSNLLSTLPSELAELVLLESLNLANNQLRNVSAFAPLSNMTRLRVLNLNNNGIGGLPSLLKGLTSLEDLRVARNELHLLPSLVIGHLTRLRRLDVSENRLACIPYNISKLSELSSLHLLGNRITVLPRELVQLTALKELSLYNLHVRETGCQIFRSESDDDKTHHTTSLFNIISIIRSAPHPLLLFALHLMSEEPVFGENIVKEGGLGDLIHFIANYDGRTQAESTKIIAKLSSIAANRELMYEEGVVGVLVSLIQDPKASLKSKLHALIALGNIALHDDNRRGMVEMQELQQVLIGMSSNPQSDDRLKRQCRKVLALLGLLDPVDGERGIRILCLDGGGTRGVNTLELMRRVEEVTGKRIHELFDIIGGTSIGGILASCVGLKHWNLDNVRLLQDKFCFEIFARRIDLTENGIISGHLNRLQSRVSNYTAILRHGSFYSTRDLEDLYISTFGQEYLIDTTMATDVKVFIVSTLANAFPPQICLWRNYQYPINGAKSRYVGNMTAKIWESLRASSSAPSYFDEFTYGQEKHQDGGCICNNPTAVAVHEAKCLWPNKKIDCIVSLGTGSVGLRENKGGFIERTVTEFIEGAASVERIHDLMADSYSEDVYFRFNPTGDSYNSELDESSKEKLEEMRAATRDYVLQPEIDARFQQMARILLNKFPLAEPDTDSNRT